MIPARSPDSDRALFWSLAIAIFAAVAVGLAARAIDRTASALTEAQTDYAIVRVIAPENGVAVAAAQSALASSPLVASATPMSARRAAELLSDWGGAPITEADVPTLRLIEVELAPDAEGDVEAALTAALALGGVTGEVIRAPADTGAADMAQRVRAVSLWGAVAFAVVMTLIVSLAARGFASRRRELVQVLCDLGATRGQASARIADEAARTGFVAGLAGAVLAALVGAVFVLLFAPGATIETLPALIWPIDMTPIAAAPLVAAVASAMGARAGAESFYAQAARLA